MTGNLPAGLQPAAADAALPALPLRRWLLGARPDEAPSGLVPGRNQARWFQMQAVEHDGRPHEPTLVPASKGFSI